MRFANCYWDIRRTGYQGVGYQDIRLDIQQSGDRERESNHLLID